MRRETPLIRSVLNKRRESRSHNEADPAAEVNTHTFIDDTRRSPFGSAVNTKDERAIAPRRAIRHDDRMADRLLIRA